MKLRLLLILSFLAAVSAYADDARIVIKQKSGNETILELAMHPVITFWGEDMVVTSDMTTIIFPLADVAGYTAYDETTGIEPVAVAPQFSNGRVSFSGLVRGAEVCVYTTDGRLVSRHAVDAYEVYG